MNKKDKKDSNNKKGNKKKPRKGLFGFLSRLFTKAELPEVSLGNNTNNNSANSNNATNTNNDNVNNIVKEYGIKLENVSDSGLKFTSVNKKSTRESAKDNIQIVKRL